MVMSRSTAVGSIVTGFAMLCLTLVAVICGPISLHMFATSGHDAFDAAVISVGLWSLFYIVPGILSIMAEIRKNGVLMAFALCFNILALIISVVASIFLIIFIAFVSDLIKTDRCRTTNNDTCSCLDGYTVRTLLINCNEMHRVHSIMVTTLVVYSFLTLTAFIASILGCLGTCCAPAEPIVVITSGAPVQVSGGTVVLATNQSAIPAGYSAQAMSSGNHSAVPAAYGYSQAARPPPANGDVQTPAHENKMPIPNEKTVPI